MRYLLSCVVEEYGTTANENLEWARKTLEEAMRLKEPNLKARFQYTEIPHKNDLIILGELIPDES